MVGVSSRRAAAVSGVVRVTETSGSASLTACSIASAWAIDCGAGPNEQKRLDGPPGHVRAAYSPASRPLSAAAMARSPSLTTPDPSAAPSSSNRTTGVPAATASAAADR